MESPALWIIFILIALVKVGVAWRFFRIYRAISQGKKTNDSLFSISLLLLFIKKKSKNSTVTFFSHPLPAILHSVLVIALLCMIAEMATYTLGLVFPITSSFFYTLMAKTTLYTSYGAIIAAIVFLTRRTGGKVKRFYSLSQKQRNDGYTILTFEILSAATYIIAYHSPYGWHLTHYTLMSIFAIYITFSKHLHIILALPFMVINARNKVFSISTMPAVSQGLDYMEGKSNTPPTEKMGATHPKDFTRKDILGAFACTQCGRCDDVCPVSMVEADFSPLQIIASLRKSAMDSTDIYPEKISKSMLYQCIGCGACATACPVSISAMDAIFQIRRYATLEEGALPCEYSKVAQCIDKTGQAFQTKNQ